MGGGGSLSGGIWETVGNVGDLPSTWFPNSRFDLRNSAGQRTQQRWFGPDGRATRNRDWSHGNRGGGHRFPHDHRWNWNNIPPRGRPENVDPWAN